MVALGLYTVRFLCNALQTGCWTSSEKSIHRASIAVTLSDDGGPVHRSSLTVFTLTVSSELLVAGRTPMIPEVLLMGGEHAIHSAVGERFRNQVKRTLLSTYVVPVAPVFAPGRPYRSTAALELPYFIHVFGGFAIMTHLLTMKKCGEVNRCCYWWPYFPAAYLSTLLLDDAANEGSKGKKPKGLGAGDGVSISRQWEVVVWALSRWRTPRDGKWRAECGLVRWACRGCQRDKIALSASKAVVVCSSPACALYDEPQARILPPASYTPISKYFRLLRRRIGGPRGYPLLGNIPLRLQYDVLHCSEKIRKGLMYFLLALLPEFKHITARLSIYRLMGRNKVGGMYIRELGRLEDMIVALPGSLVEVPVDGGAAMMMQHSQLLTSAWRRAVTNRPAGERESAAVVFQLSDAVLEQIYSALKPLDPVTKKA